MKKKKKNKLILIIKTKLVNWISFLKNKEIKTIMMYKNNNQV